MSTITEAAAVDLLNQTPFRILPAGKQVTLAFGGVYIASTTVAVKPLLVWETEKGYPRYYIPVDSLHEAIRPHIGKPSERGEITISEKTGSIDTSALLKSRDNESEAVIDHFRIGEKETKWVRFLQGPLKGYIRFEKSEMGKWRIFTHTCDSLTCV
jgi:hypothetical protein